MTRPVSGADTHARPVTVCSQLKPSHCAETNDDTPSRMDAIAAFVLARKNRAPRIGADSVAPIAA